MKKSDLIIGSAFVISSFLFNGCTSSSDKIEVVQTEVANANQSLDDVSEEFKEECASYKEEVAYLITANEQVIFDFRKQTRLQTKEAKTDFDREIDILDQKNNELRIRMDEYNIHGRQNWEDFKEEFEHDMDALGIVFKNSTLNNLE